MIADFLTVLDIGGQLGLITYDDATVRAPHRDVADFDADALASDAARIGVVVDRLDDRAIEPTSAFGDLWSGSSGDAAGRVLGETTADLQSVITEVAAISTALDSAVRAVDDVLSRYRQAMRTVCDPVLAGVDIDALPAAVAAGSVAKDDVRAELVARIEYADSVGRTASRALGDVVRAATARHADSAGELVLAGLR